MVNTFLFLVSFALIWFAFADAFSSFFVIVGCISALLTLLLRSKIKLALIKEDQQIPKKIPLLFKPRFILYCLWMFRKACHSSMRVMTLIWQVEPKLSPMVGCIDAKQMDDKSKTFLANSITMMLGSISVMVSDDHILEHALEEGSFDAMKKNSFLHWEASKIHRGPSYCCFQKETNLCYKHTQINC